MQLTPQQITTFKRFIWEFYHAQGREFAWRNVKDPYHAAASLREVLAAWQGLGYNRRGKYLQQIAQKVIDEQNGQLPQSPQLLETFPGIGKSTAASICAFAFNLPSVFIETNIRAVFIHSFFADHDTVHDRDIMPLIEQTLDHENPREWYYALMDYGVKLKKKLVNPARKSAHHTKQSKFEGSDRQIRGRIIKALTTHAQLPKDQLIAIVNKEKQRTERLLAQLCKEGLVALQNNKYHIGNSDI